MIPSRFPWPLLVFPALELGLFAAACATVHSTPWLGMTLLVAAALAMNFAIHICFHECLHYSDRRPLGRTFSWTASALMGLPFDGYRAHHRNHHRFCNAEGDFSSTWRFTRDGREPFSILSYVLGWPRQNVAASVFLREHPEQTGQERIPAQQRVILVVLVALTLLAWPFGLMYLALVYLGWAGAALHNYGQHPPIADAETTTFTQPLYNRLLFNNGLHWEHHARPGLPWHAIEAHPESPRIDSPHLLHPIQSTRAPGGESA